MLRSRLAPPKPRQGLVQRLARLATAPLPPPQARRTPQLLGPAAVATLRGHRLAVSCFGLRRGTARQRRLGARAGALPPLLPRPRGHHREALPRTLLSRCAATLGGCLPRVLPLLATCWLREASMSSIRVGSAALRLECCSWWTLYVPSSSRTTQRRDQAQGQELLNVENMLPCCHSRALPVCLAPARRRTSADPAAANAPGSGEGFG